MFHEPRPYFTNDWVIPLRCSQEFGHPSGHSLFAAGFTLIIFLDFYHSSETQKPQRSYYLALASCFTISLLMGIDRLYVGVHSLDHVIIGLALGFWLALFFHQYVRLTLVAHIGRIQFSQEFANTDAKRLACLSVLAFIL